ncbi:MAG: protein kinase [Deltaproteobacteria bacterium]|nr:protein kinase [Deltaproteobacteria bacterium]
MRGERSTSSQDVVSRGGAYVVLAVACLASAFVVWLLDRPPAPGAWTVGALIGDAALLGLLALSTRLTETPAVIALRTAGLVLVALGAGVTGAFFGPNAGFEAVIALLILLAGVLSREGGGAISSWLVYVVLAASQAVVLVLVVVRVWPDRSLTPVIVGDHPDWHHLAAHASAQGVFLAAFLAGRGLRRRYASVAAELEQAIRAGSLREALLDEARAEYRRALRLAQRGVVASTAVRASEPPPALDADTEIDPSTGPSSRSSPKRASPHPDPLPRMGEGALPQGVARRPETGRTSVPPSSPSERSDPSRRSSSSLVPPADAGAVAAREAASRAWLDAYRLKMRLQLAGVVGLCVFGALLLAFVARHRTPMWIACACMAVVALAAVGQRWLAARRGESVYWPWVLIGALSAGPAYSFGLHSAFSVVVAAHLFVGGSFRAAQGESPPGQRVPALVAVVVTHAVVFALIWTGAIGDLGNVPVLVEGAPWWEPLAQHLLLQATYLASFAAGYLVDRRQDTLVREAEAAARHAAMQEALLASAGKDIARALVGVGDGLFSGQDVGHYRVGRLIASGGMGDVYEAHDVARDRRVALKLVRGERVSDPVVLELFAKEAHALARVESPHVATVLDVGTAQDDLPYLAMEYIEGSSLAVMLRDRGRLTLEETRVMIADLARGIRAVHSAGIIHRDLKPHNVMLTAGPEGTRWKIVDFGVAQVADVGAGRAILGGTPQYMAPEQALGERVDARADLYSLGLVVYRALTGRPAFVGTDRLAIAKAAREHPPPDPTFYVDLPQDVVYALRIAVAAAPADRFATAAELASAFEAAFEDRLSERHRRRAITLILRGPWSEPTQSAAGSADE